MQEIWFVTDGRFNYAECNSLEEANKHIEELVANDKRIYKMWMDKCGYIPENVDIPSGYYATQQRWD